MCFASVSGPDAASKWAGRCREDRAIGLVVHVHKSKKKKKVRWEVYTEDLYLWPTTAKLL